MWKEHKLTFEHYLAYLHQFSLSNSIQRSDTLLMCVCVCITNEMNGNAYTSSNLLETWDSEITSNFEITKITFLHQENVVLTTLLKLNRIRTSKEKERNYAFVSLIRNRQICQIISQPVYWIYDFWILMKWLKNVVICRRDRRTSEKWVLSES